MAKKQTTWIAAAILFGVALAGLSLGGDDAPDSGQTRVEDVIVLPYTSAAVTTYFVDLGGDKYGVAYHDPRSNIAWQWNNIVVPHELVPDFTAAFNRAPLISPARQKLTVFQVLPAVSYAVVREGEQGNKESDILAPGYYFPGYIFFRWADVEVSGKHVLQRLAKSHSVTRVIPLKTVQRISIVEIPAPVKYYVAKWAGNGDPHVLFPGHHDYTNNIFYVWDNYGELDLTYEALSDEAKRKVLDDKHWPTKQLPYAPLTCPHPPNYRDLLEAHVRRPKQ